MEMGKRFFTVLLLFCLVIALTCNTGCAINDDPSLIVREYLELLKEGDSQKAALYTENGEVFSDKVPNPKLLNWVLAESVLKRPFNYLHKEKEALVRFQIIVPDISNYNYLYASKSSKDSQPTWDNLELINKIDKDDMPYKKISAEIRLVKSEGVWKISEESPFYKQILSNIQGLNI